MRLGTEKFASLPEAKKATYIANYKKEREEYNKKLENFYQKYPDLLSKKKLRATKECVALTPTVFYREKISSKGNFYTFSVAQKMWKELPEEEKAQYIFQLSQLDTDKPKKFNKEEQKLLQKANGIPQKPNNSYAHFVKEFKHTYKGNPKDFMVACGKAWKNISEEDKEIYEKEFDEEMARYIKEMDAYIKKLPMEQQSWAVAQANLSRLSRKRKNKDANESKVSKLIKIEKEKTKPVIQITENDSVKIKSPKKGDKNGVLSPPASPIKKKKLKAPHYPSQSTAHYFATKVYQGKPSKVAKAYKKLDIKQKRTYRNEYRKFQQEYLLSLKPYLDSLSPTEKSTFTAKLAEMKKEQKKEIEWHTNDGTDSESKMARSSSDSDTSWIAKTSNTIETFCYISYLTFTKTYSCISV